MSMFGAGIGLGVAEGINKRRQAQEEQERKDAETFRQELIGLAQDTGLPIPARNKASELAFKMASDPKSIKPKDRDALFGSIMRESRRQSPEWAQYGQDVDQFKQAQTKMSGEVSPAGEGIAQGLGPLAALANFLPAGVGEAVGGMQAAATGMGDAIQNAPPPFPQPTGPREIEGRITPQETMQQTLLQLNEQERIKSMYKDLDKPLTVKAKDGTILSWDRDTKKWVPVYEGTGGELNTTDEKYLGPLLARAAANGEDPRSVLSAEQNASLSDEAVNSLVRKGKLAGQISQDDYRFQRETTAANRKPVTIPTKDMAGNVTGTIVLDPVTMEQTGYQPLKGEFVTQPPPEKMIDKATKIALGIGTLRAIVSLGKQLQSKIGPIRGGFFSHLTKWVKDNPNDPSMARLKQLIGLIQDRYRIDVTGAQASFAELGLIKSRLPSVDDVNFLTNADSLLRQYEAERGTLKKVWKIDLSQFDMPYADIWGSDPAIGNEGHQTAPLGPPPGAIGFGTPPPSDGATGTATERMKGLLERLQSGG